MDDSSQAERLQKELGLNLKQTAAVIEEIDGTAALTAGLFIAVGGGALTYTAQRRRNTPEAAGEKPETEPAGPA